MSSDLLREYIREILAEPIEENIGSVLNDDAYGNDRYLNEIDRLIDEISLIKKSLRSGVERHKFRKESHRLQSAIEALRFLKRTAKRKREKMMLENILQREVR